MGLFSRNTNDEAPVAASDSDASQNRDVAVSAPPSDAPPKAMSPSSSATLSLQHFIGRSPIAIMRLDSEGKIVETNGAFERLTGGHFNGTNQDFAELLREEDRDIFTAMLLKVVLAAQGDEAQNVDDEGLHDSAHSLTLALPDKTELIVYTYLTPIPIQSESGYAIVAHLVDQTEQKNLEMRFAHSQKMQAVGQLAGGVAHDFNNLLTAMIGFCDLLLMRHPAGDPSFADIMQVKQNANRAANLVRQLLAFSRRQTLQPKTLNITDLLAELSNLIRRLIGENIVLDMMHGRDVGQVKADQGQLEQVIINLAVNGRDAMKSGGTLRISTKDVVIDATNRPGKDMIAPEAGDAIVDGDYVLVEVSDTGHGIPPDVIDKIFEPFFSTKEVGSGTGLGLATVYGIIKQTGGYLYVKSEPNKGTTFNLYFKRYEAPKIEAGAEAIEDTRAADLTGQATIMLVEDETPVRTFAARALSNKGYKVLEAECGEHAIEVFEGFEGKIDVIISDVVMPGINGPTMIETLKDRYPERVAEASIIFISGYAEDAFGDHFAREEDFNFLPKPFTLKQLAGKVKEVTS